MSQRDVMDAYRERAGEYTQLLGSLDATAAADQDLISAWGSSLDGPAVDAGCGPGHWTKFLRDQGVAVEGIDMVPEFLAEASARFQDVPFRSGTLEALPVPDGSLAGILAWYSLIHLPPASVHGVLTGFARSLRPGGSLLLGFFEGARVAPFAHAVVTAYFWPVPAMHQLLAAAGFDVIETNTRTDPGHRPHAAVLARRQSRTAASMRLRNSSVLDG